MIDQVKNNYIRPIGTGPSFNLLIDSLPDTVGTYYDESIKAAKEIADLRQGKLHLMYSGGLDSEYALSIFHKLRIEVTPVIIKLGKYNLHDIKYAFDFCQSKNITPLIVDIDFDYFVRSGMMLEICKETNSSVYHRAATAYASGKVDGTVLLGDGEPYIKLQDSEWNIVINEHEYAVYNYFRKHGIHGTTHFNSWTPEMFKSFLLDERILSLANNKHVGKLSSNSSKIFVYNRNNDFSLIDRPKYTGYEQIETSEIFQHPDFLELQKFGKDHDGTFITNFHRFIEKQCK
jgi:hypothetical protein